MSAIIFDSETGELLSEPVPIRGPVAYVIASKLLPGSTPELVDEWYGRWLEADQPEILPVGTKVVHVESTLTEGVVTSRVVSPEGELHTVMVRWQVGGASFAYSPRELKVVE